MIATLNHIKSFHLRPPICIGVHAIFRGNAYEALKNFGAQKFVTCNTIPHISNAIDLTGLISDSIQRHNA